MGVRPNSITLEEYQIAINQQAISMVQDMQDGDKGEKVEALQANMQFLYGQEINTDFVARNELVAGQRANRSNNSSGTHHYRVRLRYLRA